MRLIRLAAALLVAVPLLAACGAGQEGTEQVVTPEQPSGEPATELVITVRDGSGAGPRTWTLTCDPPGGDHPNPEAACRALDAVRNPFAPVPAGMECTQIFGGPQTATIEGTWRGERVRAEYDRTDGCQIARWDRMSAVLGAGAT